MKLIVARLLPLILKLKGRILNVDDVWLNVLKYWSLAAILEEMSFQNSVLIIEIEIAQLEVQADITMLKALLTDYKQAFKQLTGDTFTPYQKKPTDNRTDAEKLEALKKMRDKLKAA